ncbi:MAG TPA: hypothetical protein H9935_05270 [Candidatus Blautia merdigallinarum]|uniref:Uncharacterized protein n=1 Tax=Candidatus Blautia merdigallinarum TaxID=2838495 RepID=A0A9D2N537_9FIRM|nr:hypothetical protein [Candidatus Blautia merdigallinarum]
MNLKKEDSEEGKFLDFWYYLKTIRPNKTLVIFGALVIAAAAGIFIVLNHVDQNYDVLSTLENEDTQSSEYVQFGEDLLKYGNESVSLLSQSGDTLWNQTYDMSDPAASIQGDAAAIYDKRGTSMYVLKADGPVGPVATDFPIVKAEVTLSGAVAAILEDGEKTWVNYYASDGSLIVENQTRMENNGYPLDLAVSPNGEIIAVSYLLVESGEISSQVVFYNFGQTGQGQVDNVVAEFTYEDTVAPDLVYFSDSTCVAFRDDGFSVFQGEDTPEERQNTEISTQMISLFYNEEYFGIVTEGEEESYCMTLYDPAGRERCSQEFDMEYQSISISGERIVLCDSAQIEMYDLGGKLKFQGDILEGAVRNLFQMSRNRYLLVSDEGIHMIRLAW